MYWKPPLDKPQFRKDRKVQGFKNLQFSIHRPWTTHFQMENFRNRKTKSIPLEPIKQWSFFRGDRVCCPYMLHKRK